MRFSLLFFSLCIASTHPGISQNPQDLSAAKSAYAKADKELNRIYQEAKANLPSYFFDTLQQEQREWVGMREGSSVSAAAHEESAADGKERDFPSYWEMAEAMTQTRIEIIQGWIQNEQFEKEWEGVWKDGHGGILRIEELDEGHFNFSIEVVRGPTYHLGDIGGKAEINGQLARFTVDAIPGSPEEGSTWLHFSQVRPKVKILGANTMNFHGMRAYFDGEYIRVAPLSAEDRNAIRKSTANTSE